MLHVLEHTLIDSLNVFILVFILYVILNFVEEYINKKLSTNTKLSPLFGALIGLVPQCGISVVASDLYIKRRITIGTLMAVFLACNDEAIFILLASDKALVVIPLILIKLLIGFLFGFFIDLFFTKKIKTKTEEEIHIECCHHHVKSKSKFMNKFLHILLHSLEIFAYVFVVNFIFGLIFHFVGENTLILFLEKNKYLSPIFAIIVGLIPNCASSIVISELFIINGISFGALLAGLSVNAGLGLIYLFKDNKNLKNNCLILLILILLSVIIGYVTCLINGF